MKFEWDEQKNQANIKNHGLDFGDARKVFAHAMLVNLDDRKDYGEERWIGIGLMDMRVVVIVFTEPHDEIICVLSFRKATSYERKQYEQAYTDKFGSP